MRYGPDYDRGYTGYRQGWGEVGRGPETNWMGRNYRSPGEPRRARAWREEPREGGYGREHAGYRGYRPLGGMHRGYDQGYRGRGGYDQGYRGHGGYDRGYREWGGAGRGRGREMETGWGMNDPYAPYRMLQGRSSQWGDRWPSHYFTDHGHNSGPY
jgi:hypothetical protein